MENEFGINNVITTTNTVFRKTFGWMFMGLLITGLISWFTFSSSLYLDIIFNGYFNVLLIAELVVVVLFSAISKKCSATTSAVLFFTYAILNGITFSVIFAIYQLSSITILLFATAGLFGTMALYGYRTDVDLTRFAPILFITLLVGIVVSVINLFVGNSVIDILVSWVMLFVFSGVTAYDLQRLKILAANTSDSDSKLHITFALELYLDFINIFIRLLSLFGRRR